jgi:hypothetical protein
MDVALSIVAIVILILAAFLFRRTKASTNKRPPRRTGKAAPDPEFHAVSLEISGTACEAAQAMEGRRFLSSAAPRIPLPECDAPKCKCHFIHHKDRRQTGDRRKQYRKVHIGDTGIIEKEKRHRGDRRNNDPDDFFA